MSFAHIIRTAIASCLMIASVSSCSDPLKDEEDRLEMVKKNGSMADVCKQSRKVSDAALALKDARYAELVTYADINCRSAEYHPFETYDQVTNAAAAVIEPDNMDAMADTVTSEVGNDAELDP